MADSKTLLFQIYSKFYDQRSVLANAPALTIDVTQTTTENFDSNLADKELTALVSYMVGTPDITQLSWDESLALVEKYYANQPQWQNLLLSYFSYSIAREEEVLTQQQIDFLNDLLKDLEDEPESEVSDNPETLS